ncbi:MAG: ATP-binding protein [Ilumatobacteraceae bacterium]
MTVNPFTPGFGTSPLVLAGRDQILNEVELAFEFPGREAQVTLLLGPRGAGKTVLLNAIQDQAGERGWLWVQEDASRGLPSRLARQLQRLRQQLTPPPRWKLRRVEVAAVGGVEWDNTSPPTATDLRDALGALLDTLETLRTRATGTDRSAGVLITIDEIHTVDPDELRQIGLAAQYHRRQDQPVVIAMAGLPTEDMLGLLADPTIASFLQRCFRPSVAEIAQLPDDDVRQGLADTAALGLRTYAPDALDAAVDVIDGYPYLLQLVGYESFRRSGDEPTIDRAHVEQALPAALTKYGRNVTELTATRLSPVDRRFLAAMALDPPGAGSSIADLASRLGVDSNYVARYRNRLIGTGVIRPAGRGRLEFAVPGLHHYVTHAWPLEPPDDKGQLPPAP